MNESLRKHLAEKVMRYEEGCRKDEYWELDSDGNRYGLFWKPDENIEQAFMCLGTFEDWQISRFAQVEDMIDEYEITIGNIGLSNESSLPMAISLACAKATGWEPLK